MDLVLEMAKNIKKVDNTLYKGLHSWKTYIVEFSLKSLQYYGKIKVIGT